MDPTARATFDPIVANCYEAGDKVEFIALTNETGPCRLRPSQCGSPTATGAICIDFTQSPHGVYRQIALSEAWFCEGAIRPPLPTMRIIAHYPIG